MIRLNHCFRWIEISRTFQLNLNYRSFLKSKTVLSYHLHRRSQTSLMNQKCQKYLMSQKIR
jgi:hypothetical protein